VEELGHIDGRPRSPGKDARPRRGRPARAAC
jgi:hypothetical protein